MPGIYGELFSDAAMTDLFSDRATLQGMLDFEAALARDQASDGIIPESAVAPIAAAARADLYDIADIGRQATLAGNPAIPMVRLLTERVAAADPEAARWVHWGATSQDAIDTGRLIQIAGALRLIEARIDRLAAILARTADQHRRTVMAGRTLLQQALPVTFGLKAAYWLDALLGHAAALSRIAPAASLQLGGAAGTLASLGDKGPALQERMMGFDLAVPWHATRQALLRQGAELGLLTGTLGKIGRDVTLLMQTEIGEVSEAAAEGKGGSSTLPHKRNPVQSVALTAIATRTPGLVATLLSAMVQEHERAAGAWQAEWQTLPDLFILAGAALAHAVALIDGLGVDKARMRDNLDRTGGLILSERVAMALGEVMPRIEAKARVEAACAIAISERRPLRDVLAADAVIAAHLDGAALSRLFDPATYLGANDAVIDRVLALHRLHIAR
ncbi:MAG TPA: 3-carboxy-cis,cis-muconate cycloisomerase [Beijerinckiaceae bacterium]|nr:3-carboxy-cis,cis-muconate cycloisomerase [Beijerinckiaceae bacterium]